MVTLMESNGSTWMQGRPPAHKFLSNLQGKFCFIYSNSSDILCSTRKICTSPDQPYDS